MGMEHVSYRHEGHGITKRVDSWISALQRACRDVVKHPREMKQHQCEFQVFYWFPAGLRDGLPFLSAQSVVVSALSLSLGFLTLNLPACWDSWQTFSLLGAPFSKCSFGASPQMGLL